MAKPQKKGGAIDLLKQDHRSVQVLFKEFEALEDDQDAAEQVVETACTELKIHDTIETEIFCPAVRNAAEEKELFPKVKKLKSLDFRALGAEMKERRAALMAETGLGVEAEETA